MARKRTGGRRHRLTAKQHDGTKGTHGTPTYTTEGDWGTVVLNWPVELLTVSGGETLRGRQTAAETTHVFFGEYHAGKLIASDMKVEVGGVTYAVVTAYDPAGDSREMRVEARREA